MPVQPLLPMVFRAQGFQEGIRAGYRQMLLAVPGKYIFFQERRPLRHSAGCPGDNRRLVSGRRRAVDLGARLTVSRHEIQRQAAAQSAFAILFGNLDICRPEPAQPGIFMDPAEERPYELVFLPGHKLYGLPGPLADGVMQFPEKSYDVIGSRLVIDKTSLYRFGVGLVPDETLCFGINHVFSA